MAYQQFLQSGAATLVVLADSAPATNVTNTSWTLAGTGNTVAVGERSKMIFQTTRGVATFLAANEAAGPTFASDAWKSSATLQRAIPAGDWTLVMRLRSSGTAGAPSCRGRWRVFKAKNTVNGSDAIELTSGAIIGGETGQTASGSNGDTSATWSAPYIELNNEFLIVSFALEARQNLGNTGSGTREYSLVTGGASVITAPDLGPIEFAGAVLI